MELHHQHVRLSDRFLLILAPILIATEDFIMLISAPLSLARGDVYRKPLERVTVWY